MLMDPVYESAKALGHSWWPSPHWWLSLSAGDQGAWVSGLGAFTAAFVALKIASAEQKKRERQSHDRSLVAASFIYSDIVKLAAYSLELRRATIGLGRARMGEPYIAFVVSIKLNSDPVLQICSRVSLDMIGALPADVAISLARSIGAFPFPCEAIGSVINALDLMRTTLDLQQGALLQHAEAFRQPLERLAQFFRWYGDRFADSRGAAHKLCTDIHDELRAH